MRIEISNAGVSSEKWMHIYDLPGEIWMPVPKVFTDDNLFASNRGRVKKIEYFNGEFVERILHQNLAPIGYYRIKLKDKTYNVHRLVCTAFYGFDPGKEVDHINGDKMDNRAENLRWVTHKQNLNNPNSKRGSNNSSKYLKFIRNLFKEDFT